MNNKLKKAESNNLALLFLIVLLFYGNTACPNLSLN